MRLEVKDDEMLVHAETPQDRAWLRIFCGLRGDSFRVCGLEPVSFVQKAAGDSGLPAEKVEVGHGG